MLPILLTAWYDVPTVIDRFGYMGDELISNAIYSFVLSLVVFFYCSVNKQEEPTIYFMLGTSIFLLSFIILALIYGSVPYIDFVRLLNLSK